MSRGRAILAALAPWAGLVVGLLATIVVHQFGSDGTFDDCATTSPGPLLVVALIGILVCFLSGLASWRSGRGSESEALRVIAVVSAGSAAFFVFAMLLPVIAALVLPPCFG